MSPEEIVIEILLRRAEVKGELTEEEICNICEEKNIAYSKTSYIIEKLMSQGVRIISTNYGNSYRRTTSNNKSQYSSTPRSSYHSDSHNTESVINNTSGASNVVSNASNDKTVNFYSKESYDACSPTYVIYKNELFYLNSWKDVYVKVMSLLAYRYDSKLASWAGFGDIFKSKDLPENYSDEKYKSIGGGIYIRIDYSTDELLFKIRKYINVCNVDIKDVVIGYKKKTDVIESENRKSDDEGKPLIVEEAKAPINNSSVITTEQTKIVSEPIVKIADSVDKQAEIKPVNQNSDNIIKFISALDSSISDTISKLKKAAAGVIEYDDHDKAVALFSEIHGNICSLNEAKNALNIFLNNVKKADSTQIINYASSTEKSFNTIDEVIEYTEKSVLDHKKKMCLMIGSLSPDKLKDGLESAIDTLNVLSNLNLEVKKLKDLINLDDCEELITHSVVELQSSEKMQEFTVFSDFTKMKVKSIRLLNNTYEVSGMADAFSTICLYLWALNKDKLSNLINRNIFLEGKHMKVFCDSREDYYCQPLGNTGIYYRTRNKTSKEVVSILRLLLQQYNLNPETDLIFYVTDNDLMLRRLGESNNN